jgi:hypothetical protein
MLRTVLQDALQRLQHEMNNRGELLPTEMCPFVVPIFPENFDDNHAVDFFSYPFILQDDNMEDPTLCSNNTGGPPPVASLASPVGRLLGLRAACLFNTGMAYLRRPARVPRPVVTHYSKEPRPFTRAAGPSCPAATASIHNKNSNRTTTRFRMVASTSSRSRFVTTKP